MAQKSIKALAARNTRTLNRTHLITLAIHLLFNLLRLTLVNRSLYRYLLLSLPGWLIEAYFERLSRPTYGPDNELKRSGEDLEAKGLTEWMWDVLYWSWGCVVLVAVAGDRGWWAYLAVPIYSAWAAFGAYTGVRQGFAGLAGGGGEGGSGGQSKRQAKMEKRGGQKMVYR